MFRIFFALLSLPMLLAAQPATPTSPATAPAPMTPPALTAEQTANIMKQLEQLELVIGKSRTDILGAALTKFRAALAGKDVLALYLDCYRLEHFERRDLKTTEFLTWKEANEDRLKDKELLDALTLQLEYLVLTIQAQDVKDQKDMAPLVTALQAYIPRAIAAVQETVKHTASGALEQKGNFQGSQNRTGTRANTGGGGGGGAAGGGRQGGPGGNAGQGSGFAVGGTLGTTLRQSVKANDFARAYLLEDHLTRREWSYSPLDIPDIFQQVIFPYYLEMKPAEIGAQWDARINSELVLRKMTMSETEFSVFMKERQPELAWDKATFMLQKNINPLQAMGEMLKIVRDNPMHPQAGAWLQEMRRLVTASQSPSPASPSATSPAAAAGTASPR